MLYVGDSLGVGTGPYLREQLGGEAMSLDAEVGRPSSVGVGILRSKIAAGDDVVVFDLGTNDDPANPEALAADLRAARQIAGDRCLVVATLNRPPLNGVSVDGLNRAVTSFASQRPERPARRLARGAAERNPGLLVDGVHTDARRLCAAREAVRAGDRRLRRVAAARRASGSDVLGAARARELRPAAAGLGGASDRHAAQARFEAAGSQRPSQREQRLHDLAVSVGRAVGTGAEFG